MHEKRTASIQFLILRLVIRRALWSRKYGNWADRHSFLPNRVTSKPFRFSIITKLVLRWPI